MSVIKSNPIIKAKRMNNFKSIFLFGFDYNKNPVKN